MKKIIILILILIILILNVLTNPKVDKNGKKNENLEKKI